MTTRHRKIPPLSTKKSALVEIETSEKSENWLPKSLMAESNSVPLLNHEQDEEPPQEEDGVVADGRNGRKTTRIASLDVFRGLCVFVNLFSYLNTFAKLPLPSCITLLFSFCSVLSIACGLSLCDRKVPFLFT